MHKPVTCTCGNPLSHMMSIYTEMRQALFKSKNIVITNERTYYSSTSVCTDEILDLLCLESTCCRIKLITEQYILDYVR